MLFARYLQFNCEVSKHTREPVVVRVKNPLRHNHISAFATIRFRVVTLRSYTVSAYWDYGLIVIFIPLVCRVVVFYSFSTCIYLCVRVPLAIYAIYVGDYLVGFAFSRVL